MSFNWGSIPEILLMSLSIWMGAYVVSRSHTRLSLTTGIGYWALAAYLTCAVLQDNAPLATTYSSVTRLSWIFGPVATLCWLEITSLLSQSDEDLPFLSNYVSLAALIITLIFVFTGVFEIPIPLYSNITQVAGFGGHYRFTPGPAYPAFAVFELSLFVIAGYRIVVLYRPAAHHFLIDKVGIAFVLGCTGLLIGSAYLLVGPLLPFEMPRLLGEAVICIAAFVATYSVIRNRLFVESNIDRKDFAYSFLGIFGIVLIYVASMVVLIVWKVPYDFGVFTLVLCVIWLAILSHSLFDLGRDLVDWVFFREVQDERSGLRDLARMVPNLESTEWTDTRTLSDGEFYRLVRNALSELRNMPRLATNRLTGLKLIRVRLVGDEKEINHLSKATELRKILSEMIDDLKPLDSGSWDIADNWRHYNCLFLPYIRGLSQKDALSTQAGSVSKDERKVLDWYADIAPRTLHNWQRDAAQLIATSLRTQEGRLWH